MIGWLVGSNYGSIILFFTISQEVTPYWHMRKMSKFVYDWFQLVAPLFALSFSSFFSSGILQAWCGRLIAWLNKSLNWISIDLFPFFPFTLHWLHYFPFVSRFSLQRTSISFTRTRISNSNLREWQVSRSPRRLFAPILATKLVSWFAVSCIVCKCMFACKISLPREYLVWKKEARRCRCWEGREREREIRVRPSLPPLYVRVSVVWWDLPLAQRRTCWLIDRSRPVKYFSFPLCLRGEFLAWERKGKWQSALLTLFASLFLCLISIEFIAAFKDTNSKLEQ